MPKRTRSHRGFTLVELMIAVAIIGLLSSIAIPSFKNFELRSKQAERTILLTSINRAIDEYWLREGHYPISSGSGASLSWLYLFYSNPDATPSASKRPWRLKPVNAWDHWNRLSVSVQGAVYYSYYGYAYEYPGWRYTYLQATGDLDGDKIKDELDRYWYYQNNQLLKYAGYTCNDCTYEFRYPANGLAF